VVSSYALYRLAPSRSARPRLLLPPELRSPGVICLGAVRSVLPDLDVAAFGFGVPHGHLLGHRGLSHAIAFADCLSACLAWLLAVEAQASRLTPCGFLCLSTWSRGSLDALTRGGLRVAFCRPV
jgi:inner membrane protein